MTTGVNCYLCDFVVPTPDNEGGWFGYGADCDEMRKHYIEKHNPERKLYCVRCMGNEEKFDAPSLEHMLKRHKSEIASFWGSKKSTLVDGKSATRYVCTICKDEKRPLQMMTSAELVEHLWNDHEKGHGLNKIRNPATKKDGSPVEKDSGDWDYMMRPIYSLEALTFDDVMAKVMGKAKPPTVF